MADHGIARDQLRAFIERIERLEEEKKAISDDIKEVYAEGKGSGFDPKIMRMIVRIRKQDRNERAEQEAILDLYLHALGMAPEPDGDDDGPRGSSASQVTTPAVNVSASLRAETAASVTTPAGQIMEGLREAVAVAKGEAEPYAIHEPQVAPQPAQSLPADAPVVTEPDGRSGDESPVSNSPETANEVGSRGGDSPQKNEPEQCEHGNAVPLTSEDSMGDAEPPMHEEGSGVLDGSGHLERSRSAPSTIVQFHREETPEERCLRNKPHCQRPSACGSSVWNQHCYSCAKLTAGPGGAT